MITTTLGAGRDWAPSSGMATEEMLAAYPDLEREDIAESLRYAAEAVRERELPLRTVA